MGTGSNLIQTDVVLLRPYLVHTFGRQDQSAHCASPATSHSEGFAAGDALRPFLMHAFGGLYVDLDVQCFRSAEPSLLGHDIVLQSEYREGRDIVNSIMASVPGHPFWKAVITEMLEVSMPCQTS